MGNFDLIFGMHSIAEAINNPSRVGLELYATEDSHKELMKLHFKGSRLPESVKIIKKRSHDIQEEAKVFIRELGYKETRVPSHIFLVADQKELTDITELYEAVETKDSLRILALDQVTDVHNLAAIIRTTCFYGVDYVVFSKKGQNSFPPNFFRIASGGYEHINLVNCSSLSKFIHKMNERGVNCIGLSEHASENSFEKASEGRTCLVMGSEETGLSNACMRVIDNFVALKSQGQIKSLNVSVAAAVTIEKLWSV